MSRKPKKRIKTEFVDDDLESEEIDDYLIRKMLQKHSRRGKR